MFDSSALLLVCLSNCLNVCLFFFFCLIVGFFVSLSIFGMIYSEKCDEDINIKTQHLAANNFQWNGGEQNVASRSQFTRVRIAEKILSILFIAEKEISKTR